MKALRMAMLLLTALCAMTVSGGQHGVPATQLQLPAPRASQSTTPAFTIDQTIADFAQRTTIAFSGLAMMTGNLDAQSFFPPGKVADYTGFQYLRDNDPSNMGHNTSFLTRVANNVIYILDDTQLAQLKGLATAQLDQINLYGYKRFPLMRAFRRLMDGDLPTGTTGLDLAAVKQASKELYIIDGQISFDRALLYANILHSMSASQQAYLAAMKGQGWSSWPDITNEQVREKMAGLPQGTAVAVMTYASDLFSWYAGSVEADVYFCPERQGTYYGGFYIKDAPAIGHEGYSIDEQLTATAGSALCDASKGYVTQSQAAVISSLVDTQRNNLYASSTSSIVKVRTGIAALLRGLITSTSSSDSVRAQVLALSGIYGELDGENNYNYATVFAHVYATLTTNQKANLAALRRSIMSGTYADGTPFDFSVCTTPYLYSSAITDASVLAPYIANTDYLFGVGTNQASFTLSSEVGVDGGTLPAEYTCDGAGASPALSWSSVPAGTTELALMMTTLTPDGSTKWSWVLYGIPATATSLARSSSGVGTPGVSDRGSRIYEPPCSQGPGAKLYTFTLVALSAPPTLPASPDQVTGAVLTQAISSVTLGSATLNLSYTRPTTTALSAAFTFAPAAPVVAQPVAFTDTSTGTPTSWSWSFGDSSSSTSQNPTHAYSATGSYAVTLTATNGAGSSTVSKVLTVTGTSGTSSGYAVVDTAQSTCFNATGSITCPAAGQPYFGQDAQIPGRQPSYTTSSDGKTVKDNVTGLTWQQSPDTNGDGTINAADKLSWSNAQARPAALNAARYGGYSDWRMPTIKELYSLIDFRGTDPGPGSDAASLTPFIDKATFAFGYGDTAAGERIIDAQYASSTRYVSTTMLGDATGFGVNFADGRIKGYGLTHGGQGDMTFYVRCVRGAAYGVNDFVDNGDATVTDRASGLMWARGDTATGLDWQEALAWVQARNAENHLGHDDWRLPNAKELQSLVDYTRSPDTTASAAINPLFTCTSITNEAGHADYPFYWTGTTHMSSTGVQGAAVYIAFGRAMGYMTAPSNPSIGAWLDVHGAGAQRSDPKEGNPADFPKGRGPQGDAIRIYNYVRLVRDAGGSRGQTIILPAVAHLRGISATFTSRIEMLNTGASAMTVTALYTPREDIGGASRTTTLALPAGASIMLDDPLGAWFGLAATDKAVGSVRFAVTSGNDSALLVTSVITARNDDGSEYGQDLPATREADALSAGETAYLTSVVDTSRTRINFAATALDDGTVLTVQPVEPLGFPLAAARTISLASGASTQINDLNTGAAGFALGNTTDYLLVVHVTSGRALVYGSVLDGTATVPGTNDPTTILPARGGAATVTLLQLGPVQGYDQFAGSAQIANLSAIMAEVTADFHARGVPGVTTSTTFTIPAGDTIGYQDLVGELFHTTGVGTVVLRATNGTSLIATGREYAVLRNASGAVTGTAGQLVPGMTDSGRLLPGATYHLLGLRQRTVGTALERSNLAVFNPGTQDATVTVVLLDGATGVQEGVTTISARAGELVQVNSIIQSINQNQDGTTKRLKVTVEGPVFLKASRVNAWGDPITVDALAQ